MKFLVLFLLVIPIASFGIESESNPTCLPPSNSQWNQSIEDLVKVTKNIVLAELVSSSVVDAMPDIKSDFPAQTGIAADGRRDNSGRMKSLENRGNTRWKFKVLESLKGDLAAGSELSFVSMRQSSEKQPVLTPILCDYVLNFKVGRKYLVFVNSFHPKGYQAVSGIDDPFFKKIQSLSKDH